MKKKIVLLVILVVGFAAGNVLASNCLSYMPGDINGDCYVNFADIEEMAANWPKCNDVSNLQCQ